MCLECDRQLGKARWPRPTCYLAGSRCLTLLPRSHTDVKPPWRKPGWFCWGSHIRGKDGKESASAGCLVKTGLLYYLVLVWGPRHEAWPERGPHGHKLWGLNLNITSIKTWPKYCVCEADFSIPSPDLNRHLGFLHLLWQIFSTF